MPRTAYEALLQHVKECRLLESCAHLLGWDERTYMPRRGSKHRGEQMALLARLGHEMFTSPAIGDLLGQVEQGNLVTDPDGIEKANVREIRRAYDRAVKLPKRLVEELARTTTQAQQVWETARRDDNFTLFQPWLDMIVKLKREEAQAVGFKEAPYDALLDEYEPGATTAEITRVFADLKSQLVPLIASVIDSGRRPPTEILQREYPVDRQAI